VKCFFLCRIWANEGDEDDSCSQSAIRNSSHVSSQSECGSINDLFGAKDNMVVRSELVEHRQPEMAKHELLPNLTGVGTLPQKFLDEKACKLEGNTCKEKK